VATHEELCSWYKQFRKDEIDELTIKGKLHLFVKAELHNIELLLPESFEWQRDYLCIEIDKCLVHKVVRMKKIEKERKEMPEQDIFDNIETAFTSALYTYLRALYNDKQLCKDNPQLATALFVFLRNYAYSGMFRYNDKGEFNVPYGGISYNHKLMQSKVDYYHSPKLLEHFAKTTIENLDFLDFFRKHNPTEKDFVFLDPPYDTEFSTYAQNEFTQADQKRLADYLCEECKAKWQLVIKYTPFIYSLYDRKGIIIQKFDKKYLVSFMNRNDKDVEHLIITNYKDKFD
jgi:DNA adenine methylase